MIRMIVLAVALMTVPSLAAADEIVRYRLQDWKAKHIHDAKKAETIAGTLKKLRCEVKRNQHDGHEDVRYRCPKWHELKLKTHDDAHKWEKWFKEYEFETEHKH